MRGKPHTYLIIGCGHFGSRAAEKLFQKDPHSRIIVVDKNKKAFQKISHLPIQTALCDGLFYLNQFLSEGRKTDYIIPAIPLHLAFEFILLRLNPSGARRARVPLLSDLPNPAKGKKGDLYTSLADFLCPEDCPGPARHCTVTGKKREKPLYQILRDLKEPFESRVIISEQLTAGVGGYRSKALLVLLEEAKKLKHSGRPILVSTASRCHGVTSALSL